MLRSTGTVCCRHSAVIALLPLVFVMVACFNAGSSTGPAQSGENSDGSSAAIQLVRPLQGGDWQRAVSADPTNLNPILTADAASTAVTAMLFPRLVGQDPMTGQYVANGGLAERWEVSPDGQVWTFYLRPNVLWTDEDPVDASDFKFTYDAIASDKVDSPYKPLVSSISSIEIVNPLTVRITFSEARCDVLSTLRVGWMPSHLYEPDFSDVMDNPLNLDPEVTAGPFQFQNWLPGESVVLRRNARYWQGAPQIQRMIFRVLPDAEDRLAGLLAGQLDEARIEPRQLSTLIEVPNLSVARFARDGYDFLALNLASPENVQAGLNENGALVFQDPHPILGDHAVRQAIAHAIDLQGIIDTVYLGQGYPLAVNVPPVIPWAHDPSLQLYSYDPDLARALLEDAGWFDTNRDGVREKGTKRLQLRLIYAEDNALYARIAEVIEDQLDAVGFLISVAPVPMRTFSSSLLNQTYDLALSGWIGLGADPDDRELWLAANDRPGSGFNFVSYQNPRIEELLRQGLTVPGCQLQDRAPIYRDVQQIIHDDLPYLFISGTVQNIAYNNRWNQLAPGPWSFYHNVHEWYSIGQ